LPPQVLGDHTPAGGVRLAGEQPTVVDKQGWESALDYYFQPEASAEKGGSKGKKLRKAPRTTTLDYINAMPLMEAWAGGSMTLPRTRLFCRP
jgi:hypothetical protein